MPIVQDKYQLAYHPIPKVACTSIKTLFYEMINGKKFEKASPGDYIHRRDGFQSVPATDEDWSTYDNYTHILVIRDPVERFLSAYSNRVIHYKELTLRAIGKLKKNNPKYHHDRETWNAFGALALLQANVKANPNADFFIQHIEKYRKISGSIKQHTALQTEFITRDLSRFKIFKIEELDKLGLFLSDALNRKIEIPKMQTGGPRIEFDSLERPNKVRLLKYCEPDYEILQDYYIPPSL